MRTAIPLGSMNVLIMNIALKDYNCSLFKIL